jgi:hypothetical protein
MMSTMTAREELVKLYEKAKLEVRIEELEEQIRGMREDHSRLFALAGRLMRVVKAANRIPRNRVFATTRDLALYDAIDALHVGDLEDSDGAQTGN